MLSYPRKIVNFPHRLAIIGDFGRLSAIFLTFFVIFRQKVLFYRILI